ncbi:MAG: bifunctional metallophosphatase/5'-nucleotidase [Lentisphaeria bacterium]|nr:bifunctional metallophosphatase/5'-nucleotidase [Lentisphaeria bacterium]
MGRFCTAIFILFLGVLVSAGEVFLFQTTDLHGMIHNSGGISGAPSVLQAVAEDADRLGRDKSILIDCGDLLQGSLESADDQGYSMIFLLNAARYDIWVPGNHDFEFGRTVFTERIRSFKGNVLAANLRFPSVKPYHIFRKNGYKIAIIGMTNPHLDKWIFRPEKEGFHVSPLEHAYRKILPELLREKPDAIILAVHSGLYPSKRLGDEGLFAFSGKHPEIQLVLGGHTHEKVVCKSLGRSGACYFQAGAHGGGYIRVRLDFDDKTGKLRAITGEYIPVPPKKRIAEPFMMHHAIRRPVVTGNFPVNASPKQIAGRFAEAILKGFPEAAGVFHGVLTNFQPKYPVLNRLHLFHLCPFENKVVLAKITRAEYEEILREQESAAEKYKMEQYFFLRGTDDPWSGAPDRRVTIAFNSYAAASAGGRFPILKKILNRPESQAVLKDKRVFDLLEKSLGEKK